MGDRTDALLAQRFRRLKIRYEHRADIHLAFLQLGCAVVSLRFLGYGKRIAEAIQSTHQGPTPSDLTLDRLALRATGEEADDPLFAEVCIQRNLMIVVATGRGRIEDYDDHYRANWPGADEPRNRRSQSVPDGVLPSATDAGRMIESFFAQAAAGGSNESVRRPAKAAFQLAVEVQHKRTADFRAAALCLEAISSVTNIVAILLGQRDRD